MFFLFIYSYYFITYKIQFFSCMDIFVFNNKNNNNILLYNTCFTDIYFTVILMTKGFVKV